jgi:hypothetical protein
MTQTINLNADAILNLDLTPALPAIEAWLAGHRNLANVEVNLRFAIDYPQAEDDPRELSEIPEVRLWFIRLDALYPWLPLALDWQQGELARYVAMLVPHQFNRTEGIIYNPEALEIWAMHAVFYLVSWLKIQKISDRHRLKFMTQMLGYELEDGLFQLLDR